MATPSPAYERLAQAGLTQPHRLGDLLRRTIARMQLDLDGMTVLTEAASGPFVVTPILAALAGAARVVALTRDSRYATVGAVHEQTRALQVLTGAPDTIELPTDRTAASFGAADIVTNLGFVRPLNAATIAWLKPTAVIPLMCEAWEFRPGDVDLAACRARGIPVLGTNEDHAQVEVFAYCPWLALKLLLAAGIEAHHCRLVVVGADKFATGIARQFSAWGLAVQHTPDLHTPAILADADAVLVADYLRATPVIGVGGDVTAAALAAAAPGLTIVQFAGGVDVAGLRAHGLAVYPGEALAPHRMVRTLADLGPRPVIELHAAGLKVGAALAIGQQRDAATAEAYALAHSPAQRL